MVRQERRQRGAGVRRTPGVRHATPPRRSRTGRRTPRPSMAESGPFPGGSHPGGSAPRLTPSGRGQESGGTYTVPAAHGPAAPRHTGQGPIRRHRKTVGPGFPRPPAAGFGHLHLPSSRDPRGHLPPAVVGPMWGTRLPTARPRRGSGRQGSLGRPPSGPDDRRRSSERCGRERDDSRGRGRSCAAEPTVSARPGVG